MMDGERPDRVRTGYSVAAANSRAYGGGMFIAPHAELDDGLLDVITVSDVSKLRFLSEPAQGVQGHPHRERRGHRAARRDGRDQADRDFAVYADGEHLTDLPATVRVAAARAQGDRATGRSRSA